MTALVDAIWRLDTTIPKRLILLAMADYANDGERSAPSVTLLAWKTGYGERQVQRLLKALVADGALCVDAHRPGKTTVYRLTPATGAQKPAFTGDIAMSPLTDVTPDIAMSPPDGPTPDIAMSPVTFDRGDIAMSPKVLKTLIDNDSTESVPAGGAGVDAPAPAPAREPSHLTPAQLRGLGMGALVEPAQQAAIVQAKASPYWQAFVRGWDGIEPSISPHHAARVLTAIETLERREVPLDDVEACTRERLADPKRRGDYALWFLVDDLPAFWVRRRNAAAPATNGTNGRSSVPADFVSQIPRAPREIQESILALQHERYLKSKGRS